MTILDAVTLRQVVSKRFVDKQFAVHHEVGLNSGGSLRADLVATNTKPTIIICEIKSSVQDFKQDKKWQNYLPYCTQFYFVMAVSVYAKVKDLIPKSVGVFTIDENLTMTLVGKSAKRKLTTDNTISVLSRCSYRTASLKRSARKNETNGAAKVASVIAHELAASNLIKNPVRVASLIKTALRPYI